MESNEVEMKSGDIKLEVFKWGWMDLKQLLHGTWMEGFIQKLIRHEQLRLGHRCYRICPFEMFWQSMVFVASLRCW